MTYRHGSGKQVCTVTELEHEDFVHFRCQFQGVSGFIQHLAFVNGTVDADYEIKSPKDSDVTYVRAVADYTAPLWPTAIAIVFALASLLGMNTGGTAGTFVMGSLMTFWILCGAAMQYLPRVFAFKYVTGPVLARLVRQADAETAVDTAVT